MLHSILDLFLHLDVHLQSVIAQYGALTYGLLFLIVFCETGLVVTPFLPGDSLLFAAGAFAARGAFQPAFLFLLLAAAAVLGDTVNYAIGHVIGPRVFQSRYRFLNREHLLKAERFYEKYGGKTIILARFMPIIRTLAPFVAGVGKMDYPRFLAFNMIGGVAWVALFLFGGYFFGNIPAVEKNFSLVILVIIVLSVLPAIVEFMKSRMQKKRLN